MSQLELDDAGWGLEDTDMPSVVKGVGLEKTGWKFEDTVWELEDES